MRVERLLPFLVDALCFMFKVQDRSSQLLFRAHTGCLQALFRYHGCSPSETINAFLFNLPWLWCFINRKITNTITKTGFVQKGLCPFIPT